MDGDVLEVVIKLLSHYKSCSNCPPDLLHGILHPSLLADIILCSNCKTQNSKCEVISQRPKYQNSDSIGIHHNVQCAEPLPLKLNEIHCHLTDNVSLSYSDIEIEEFIHTPDSILSSDSPLTPCTDQMLETVSFNSMSVSNSIQNITESSTDEPVVAGYAVQEEQINFDAISLISVSTTSEISDIGLYSDISDAIIPSSISCFSAGDHLSDVSDVELANASLDTTVSNCHIPLQNSAVKEDISVQDDDYYKPKNSTNVLAGNKTNTQRPLGRSAIRNAITEKASKVEAMKNILPTKQLPKKASSKSSSSNVSTLSTSNKSCTSSDGSSPTKTVESENTKIYQTVTTRDINESMWGKHVSLEGRVTRCFTVPKSKYLERVKLLNMRDTKGISQVTLRGDISNEADEMRQAGLIVVRGTCYKRQNTKSKICVFEVVVHSWNAVSDKANTSHSSTGDKVNTSWSSTGDNANTSRSSLSDKKSNSFTSSDKENIASNTFSYRHSSSARRQSPNTNHNRQSSTTNYTRQSPNTQQSPNTRQSPNTANTRQYSNTNHVRHSAKTDHHSSRETTPEIRTQKPKKAQNSEMPYISHKHKTQRYEAHSTSQKLEACYVSEARYVSQNSEERYGSQNSEAQCVSLSPVARTLKPLESAVLSITRTMSKPPPLVPIENRTSLAAQYSPIAYFDMLESYVGHNIVTWGTLSNVTSSTALLIRNNQTVKLYSPSTFSTKGSLVLIEGSPFFDNNNDIAVAVIHIEDLYYKHVPCLKYLASTRDIQVKTVGQLPKVTNGSELSSYHGRTILMRAKLLCITMSQGNNRGYGRVVAGDGVSCHFSFVHCEHKFKNLKTEDQVVLIGKVDYDNNKNAGNNIPWITIEHIQVIPNKEEDSVLGFAKTAIYEALKQIVMETLKQEEMVDTRDPWNFLND